MDNPQKNKLSMFLAVLGVMENYQSAWTALTGVQALVTQLTDLTADIQANSGVQGTPRTGIAQGKNRKQVDMINLAVAAAGDLHAYAVAQGDDTLAAQSDVELSDLVKMADALVGPRCQQIHDLAQTNAAAIAVYGTTAADLTALGAAIAAYEAVATAPRVATAQNTVVTGDIGQEVRAATTLLDKQLDRAMAKFKTKAPDFFHAYKNARVIVDLGVVHGKPPLTPIPPVTK